MEQESTDAIAAGEHDAAGKHDAAGEHGSGHMAGAPGAAVEFVRGSGAGRAGQLMAQGLTGYRGADFVDFLAHSPGGGSTGAFAGATGRLDIMVVNSALDLAVNFAIAWVDLHFPDNMDEGRPNRWIRYSPAPDVDICYPREVVEACIAR